MNSDPNTINQLMTQFDDNMSPGKLDEIITNLRRLRGLIESGNKPKKAKAESGLSLLDIGLKTEAPKMNRPVRKL